MTDDNNTLAQDIQNFLSDRLTLEDTQAKVRVRRTSLGWLKLRIVASYFEDKSLVERENKIDELLTFFESGFNLGQYPIAGYELLTPKEDTNQPFQYIQLPLWSEILMAPEPDSPVEVEEDTLKKPLIVTFYSFKGGVGRSTALGLVGGILATRNRRVVMVDFDLEAPGISIMLHQDIENTNGEQYGVLDYLHQRSLTPEENIPNIGDEYTYNWVRTRIADGQKNCFPGSLILLLEEAVKIEKKFSTEYGSEITLRPKALINAFPNVSQQRVAEVRNEYPELENFLERLQGERSPIDENRLAEIWNVEDGALALRIKDMVKAGILTERSRPKDPRPRVYGVAELYLYGLGMVRKGQR